MLSLADGTNRSVIKISARYVPVDIVLEPRESINSERGRVTVVGSSTDQIDMGVLRVELIGAKNLVGADRSGKSDVS